MATFVLDHPERVLFKPNCLLKHGRKSKSNVTSFDDYTSKVLDKLGLSNGAMDLRGKPLLYLPNRLFKDNGTAVDEWNPFTRYNPQDKTYNPVQDYDPLANEASVQSLPFDIPYGFQGLSCNAFAAPGPLIHNNRFSTGPYTQTGIAKAIEGLNLEERLVKIRHSTVLIQNLARYADPASAGVAPISRAQLNFFHDVYGVEYNKAEHRGLTTLGGPDNYNGVNRNTFEYPHAISQYDAICGLGNWFMSQRHRTPAIVESEAAVHDEFRSQVLDPLQYILRTRYGSRATPEMLQMTQVEVKDSLKVWIKDVTAPRFGRTTGKLLMKPDAATGTTHKAGYDDFVLFDTVGTTSTMSVELKPFWSKAYSDEVYDNLAKGIVVDSETEEMKWTELEKAPQNHLLKQLWGQLVYAQNDWGLSSNGSRILIYARTGPNELTISNTMKLEDKSLFPTLAGLAFASIDAKVRFDMRLAKYLRGERSKCLAGKD